MNLYDPTLTASRLAIQVAKEYGLRVVTEENERPDREAQLNLLRDIITDLKTSDRYYSFRSLQNVHEIYKSVCSDPYSTDFIHNGATFVAMTLGKARYSEAVSELSAAYLTGFTTTVNESRVNLIDNGLPEVLRQNSWLVFCLLSRFAWFNEPLPETSKE